MGCSPRTRSSRSPPCRARPPLDRWRSASDGAGRKSGHRGAQTRRFLPRIDERSTTMAETKRMTAEEVVGYLLEGEGLDFLRESLSWVVQQLMEAEVSELVGTARGERAPEERLTHRNGCRARPWQTRAGELEPASALGASARLGRAGGVRRRRLHPKGRPGGRVARAADLQERGLEDLTGARRAGRRLPQPPARGPLPVPVARREDREGARLGPGRGQGELVPRVQQYSRARGANLRL
jgi:hypothetical protein